MSSIYSRSKQIIILLQICLMLKCATSNPLFFSNPFGNTKAPDGDSENVSIYTTPMANEEGRAATTPPSVYRQIAKNVLERIASPVVSHFILVSATERSAKLTISSEKPSLKDDQLEIVEDPVTEVEDDTISTDQNDVQIEEVNSKESTNPLYVKTNPSFNRTSRRDDSKPERIVLYPVMEQVKKEASEVQDLNKVTSNFFNSVSDLPDDEENELETNKNREEIDPDVITNINEKIDVSTDSEVETEDDEDFTVTTVRSGLRRNFSESGAIYILELLGSAYAILTGLLQSLFNRNPNMDTMK